MAASMKSVERETPGATASEYCTIHDLYRHPKYHQMQSFGFSDEEQIRLSLLVYLDLTESKSWWNVQVNKSDALQKVLISGHPSRKDPVTYVLASSKEAQMSMAMFSEILQKLREERNIDRVIMALVGGDSDTVYYTICDGLMKPEPPEALEAKKSERQRKMRRRYTRFIRLAQMPHNRPQFALHSARAKQQQEEEEEEDDKSDMDLAQNSPESSDRLGGAQIGENQHVHPADRDCDMTSVTECTIQLADEGSTSQSMGSQGTSQCEQDASTSQSRQDAHTSQTLHTCTSDANSPHCLSVGEERTSK